LVESLVVRYLNHIGKNMSYSESRNIIIRLVLRTLNASHGKQPVSSFGPSALKFLRQQWIDDKKGRDTINNYVGIIKQVFCWGAEEEIIPADVAASLKMVQQLRKGRTAAVEYDDIQPVADAVVETTLPFLMPHFQVMVRVQRLMSGRPQDVLNLRLCDIDRAGEIWKYTPLTHKNIKRGKCRELPIGPRAQKLLKPYIEQCKDCPERFVFINRSGKPYTGKVYARAIADACQKAKAGHWSPNQLRHSAGTENRAKFGLEHAQARLGHASASTTQIYAKSSYEKAEMVAKELG
jgi:integrase